MLKKLTKFMCLLLSVIIICSGADLISSADEKDDKENTVVEAIAGYNATAVEQEAIGFGFIPVIKEGDITLYYKNETAEIAVFNAKDNTLYYSNPQNIPENIKGTPLHRLKSQLYITYYEENTQIKFYSSSFDSLSRKQVTPVITDGNVLSVNYVFGKKKITKEMLPIAIPKDKFEKKVLSKLEGEDKQLAQKQYKLISADDKLTDATRKKYEANYANFKRTDIYILNSYIASYDIEPLYDILYATDYTQADFKEDNEAAGAPSDIEDTNVVFDLTLNYKIENQTLKVSLDCSKLTVLDNADIYSIDILQFFGAASTTEKGYFLVPSGSGGLISFNSTKTGAAAYSEFIYGNDRTIRKNNLENNETGVLLPVLGISNTTKNNGIFVVAEEAAEYCTVNADIAEETSPYNMAYFSAVVNPYDEMSVYNPISGGGTTQIYVRQKTPYRGNVTLSYHFLGSGKNTYSDMANLYRNILVKNKTLTEKVSGETPFVYSILGGIDVQKHFLGIPYTGMMSLTTFKQAEEIINELNKAGIENQKVKYLDWFNGGAKQTLADKVKVLGCLGGNKSLQKLMKNENAEIYPNVNFSAVSNTLFDSFSVRKDAARLTYNEAALLYPMSIPKNFFDYNADYSYIVSPTIYDDTITKFLKKYEYKNIALSDLANQLNGDYDEMRYTDRTASMELTVSAINKLSEKLNIIASAANLYAVPTVDILTDMPVSSAGANIIDTDVPFVQLVYSGYKDMTTSSINLSYGDFSLSRLLAFGTAPSFTFGYEDSSVIMDTEYTGYYTFCFKDWKEDAVDLYTDYAKAMEKVRGVSVTGHKAISEDVYEITYENGCVIIVNDSNADIKYGGQTVAAGSYTYKEG